MKVRIYATDGTDLIYNNAPENIFDDEQAYYDFEAKMNRRFNDTFDYAEPYKEALMELIERVCNFSKNGMMGQAFLIEAVRHYADSVIEQGIPEKDPDDGTVSFISPELWLSCAEEWREEFSTHFKS